MYHQIFGQMKKQLAQIELLGAAVLEQRDGLERLRRGAEAGAQRRIAGEGEEASVRVDDGDGAGVEGLDVRAAVDAREDVHAANYARAAAPLPLSADTASSSVL